MSNRKPVEWTRLDNAAKIFPPNTNEKDTKVFRISCKLKETIDKEMLQEAQEKTMKSFPFYKSVLRKGVFWYYFETMDLQHDVVEEEKLPCSSLYRPGHRNYLFQVSYYDKKINLEVYHALTDGSGALAFLKTLLHYYIIEKHKDDFTDKKPLISYDASMSQRMDDSFSKYYTKNKRIKGIKIKKAYKIPGRRSIDNRTHIIEGTMPVQKVLDIARNHNTTLTVYLTALFMNSIYKEMPPRYKKYPIVLSIPVDLRGHFASGSARNFFATISVGYDFSDDTKDFNDLLESIKNEFKKKLNEKNLKEHLNVLAALERNAATRVIPLGLKDMVLRIANNISAKGITGSISNVGRVEVPEEMQEYIEQFSIYTSARRPQICMCSYKDVLSISMVSPFVGTDIQKNFFRTLANQGCEITISSNLPQ